MELFDYLEKVFEGRKIYVDGSEIGIADGAMIDRLGWGCHSLMGMPKTIFEDITQETMMN